MGCCSGRNELLGVIEQSHEAKVHVQLLMTMEKRESRIIGDKVYFILLIATEHYNVFHYASGRRPGEVSHLEGVTMKMDGVNIIAGVAHAEAIAPALLEVECSWRDVARHFAGGEGKSIYGPPIEAIICGVIFGERHFNSFIGRRSCSARLGEVGVIPSKKRRREPLRFAGPIGVLDDNAHAVATVVIIQITEDPHTGMIHLYNGGNTLCRAKPKYGNMSCVGNGVPIERND